jgi:hypothetical protein
MRPPSLRRCEKIEKLPKIENGTIGNQQLTAADFRNVQFFHTF